MKKHLLLILIGIIFNLNAQKNSDSVFLINYMKAITSENPNFFDIQKSYEIFWNSLDSSGKVKHYRTNKLYKRWEWFWLPRMQGSNGDINKISEVYLQQLIKNTNSNQNKKIDGCPDWIPIGMDTILSPNAYSGVGRLTNADFHPFYNGKYNYGITPPSNDSNGNTLFASSWTGGIFKSKNGGKNWINLNTDNLPFTGITEFEISRQDPNKMIIASSAGFQPADDGWHGLSALYKTTNGGGAWQSCGAPYNTANSSKMMRDIEIIPYKVNNEFVLACSELGIHKSDDYGSTWNITNYPNLNYNYSRAPTTISWSKKNSRKIFLSGSINWTMSLSNKHCDTIFYSNDYGNNWKTFDVISMTSCNPNKLDLGLPNSQNKFIEGYAVYPSDVDSNVIYVAVRVLVYSQSSFITVCGNNNIPNSSINIVPIVYLFKSINGGNSYRRIQFQNTYPSSLYIQINPYKLVLSNIDTSNIFMYYNNGSDPGLAKMDTTYEFKKVYPYKYHSDTRMLKIKKIPQPNSLNQLIYGIASTDGGVNICYNLNDSFFNKNAWINITGRGLQVSQPYRHSSSVLSKDRRLILFGGQDISHHLRIDNKTKSWKHIFPNHGGHKTGDGMSAIIDYADSNIMYSSDGQGNGVLLKSTFNPNNQQFIHHPIKPYLSINEKDYWVVPIELNPRKHESLIVAYQNIYRAKSSLSQVNNSYLQLQSLPFIKNHSVIAHIAVDENDTNIIYGSLMDTINIASAKKGKRLFRTKDNGATWEWLGGDWVNFISDIEIDPIHPKTLFVSIAGVNYTNQPTKRVMKSTDGGITWQNFSKNLPDLPANSLFIDKKCELLFVGTDQGVFKVNLLDSNWTQYGCGLPNTLVTDLDAAGGYLRASTHGRGLWEVKLPHCEVENKNNKGDEIEGKNKSKKNEEISIKASPNPSNGKFKIELDNIANKKLKLMIYDINGKVLFDSDLSVSDFNYQTIDIDLSKQSNGVYVLEIVDLTGLEGKKVLKLVKQ